MRRRSLAVATGLCVVLVAGCGLRGPASDLADEPEVPDPVSYVALGDSVAAGTAATTSYVDEYAAWFERASGSSVQVSARAVPGWTVEDLLPAIRDDDELRAELADAHLVTFNIGGNDLLAALRQVAAGTCGGDDGQACLRDATAALASSWDDLLAELVEVTGGDVRGLRTFDVHRPAGLARLGPVAATLEAYLDEVNDHLVASAEEAGIEVAEVHDAFARDDERLLAPDGIHPSDRGHARIAEALAELGTEVRTTG